MKTNTADSRQNEAAQVRKKVSSSQLEHRRLVRALELDQAMAHFPRGAKVLEIGAGAGWQAKILSERGFDVTAIDIAESNYVAVRQWPVIDYDGYTIPSADSSFDVVFSSNVLEHIPHVEAFQLEIQRVLKPGGLSLHIMPSATWRLWTIVSFYCDRLKKSYGQGSPRIYCIGPVWSVNPTHGTRHRKKICP